jgi:hypothetical protein
MLDYIVNSSPSKKVCTNADKPTSFKIKLRELIFSCRGLNHAEICRGGCEICKWTGHHGFKCECLFCCRIVWTVAKSLLHINSGANGETGSRKKPLIPGDVHFESPRSGEYSNPKVNRLTSSRGDSENGHTNFSHLSQCLEQKAEVSSGFAFSNERQRGTSQRFILEKEDTKRVETVRRERNADGSETIFTHLRQERSTLQEQVWEQTVQKLKSFAEIRNTQISSMKVDIFKSLPTSSADSSIGSTLLFEAYRTLLSKIPGTRTNLQSGRLDPPEVQGRSPMHLGMTPEEASIAADWNMNLVDQETNFKKWHIRQQKLQHWVHDIRRDGGLLTTDRLQEYAVHDANAVARELLGYLKAEAWDQLPSVISDQLGGFLPLALISGRSSVETPVDKRQGGEDLVLLSDVGFYLVQFHPIVTVAEYAEFVTSSPDNQLHARNMLCQHASARPTKNVLGQKTQFYLTRGEVDSIMIICALDFSKLLILVVSSPGWRKLDRVRTSFEAREAEESKNDIGRALDLDILTERRRQQLVISVDAFSVDSVFLDFVDVCTKAVAILIMAKSSYYSYSSPMLPLQSLNISGDRTLMQDEMPLIPKIHHLLADRGVDSKHPLMEGFLRLCTVHATGFFESDQARVDKARQILATQDPSIRRTILLS